MAGIIPLVYDTIINVRSSGQIFLFSLYSFTAIALTAHSNPIKGKDCSVRQNPVLQILRSAYFVRKSLLLKQKYLQKYRKIPKNPSFFFPAQIINIGAKNDGFGQKNVL